MNDLEMMKKMMDKAEADYTIYNNKDGGYMLSCGTGEGAEFYFNKDGELMSVC